MQGIQTAWVGLLLANSCGNTFQGKKKNGKALFL
jgi:hypothetical protein